jgi:pimeloyl-ACP methyl ester carboxylesterase
MVVLALAAVFLFRGDLPAAEVDAKYSNAASRFLTTSTGARIHYRDEGNPTGLPVVLIHGAMASLHTWEPWVALLGDDFRLVTLDLPGHGLTGAVPDGDYDAEAFSAAIEAVADELGLQQFVLGGNSMGGGATWRFTLANPQRVIGMILVASVPPGEWRQTPDEQEQQSAAANNDGPIFFKLMNQGWFRATARYLDPKPLVEQGLRSAYHNSPVVDQQLIDRYYELALREGTRAAILQRASRFRGDAAPPPDLSRLTMPTLIMWGANDALIPVSLVPRFESALPNASSVVYDDLGHVPMEEDPQRTAADVRAFLERSFDLAD